MPRPQTGSPRWSATLKCWLARVALPDGTRKPIPMTTLTDPADKAGARTMAALVARRVHELGAVDVDSAETVNEWFERWVAARIAAGIVSTDSDRGRFKKWISTVVGAEAVARVTKRMIEMVVQKLDAAVAAGDISGKTAILVWGVVTKMFDDACASKVLELRVREDNPARDVRGPERGVERAGPYLYPSEFLALMRCVRVPSRWKRLVALAVYTYTRRGELAALDWPAVNDDQGYVHVHRACNRKGHATTTKTSKTRKVPIETTLAPLLARMREDAGGEGRVVTAMPPIEDMADRLRTYVRWALEDAGMRVREDLFADDEARRPLSWHDLRHTGLTWRAVRGDDPMKIMRAAGHANIATTQGYINEAETFESAETFGQPFPALDVAALTGESNWTVNRPGPIAALVQDQKTSAAGASPTGFEPVLAA